MTEVLTRFPDTTETETQFEQFDQLKTEELLFPKLDGILLPIVIDNADVIAPCEWMGGTEVSLSLALNNYYRPMTEENADEVIAEVYEFLARQSVPEIVIEQESDYTVELTSVIAPQIESVAYDEYADTVDEPCTYTPPIHTEVTENAIEPTTISIAIHEVPADKASSRQAQPASKQRTIAFEPWASDTPETPQLLQKHDEQEEEQALELSQPVPTVARTPPASPASIEPHVLEVDREYVINHDPLSEPIIEAEEILRADIGDAPVLRHPINQEIELVSATRDEVSREAPLANAGESIELPSAEDEAVRAHEESMEYEQPNMEECLNEHDRFNVGKGPLGVTRETEPTPSDTDKTIMEIDSLLSDARQPTEVDETNEAEPVKGLADIIADMAASLELDEDGTEIATHEGSVQEELTMLYTEILDGSPFNHRDRFIHLLATLTIESQDSRESDVPIPAVAMRTKIKSLKVAIKSLRQTGNRMVAIGRLALKSHAMARAINSSAGFYIRGARS